MSEDLNRAVDARIDAFRPDAVPPFDLIEARKRRRERRRMAVAASALSVAALGGAGAVLLSAGGGGDRLDQAQPAAAVSRTTFSVQYAAGSPVAGRADGADAALARCSALPGAQDRVGVELSDPPLFVVTVMGTAAQTQAVYDCLTALDASTVRTLSAADAGLAVDICFQTEGCRALGQATADDVLVELGLDTSGGFPTVGPNQPSCREGSAVYTVKIHYVSGVLDVVVPRECGPMQVNGEDRPIDDAVRAQVRNAYETAAVGVRHSVHSHCGVLSTTVEEVLWLADPPLGDHNPPPGWDDNDTSGVFFKQRAGDAVFTADSGVTAHFVQAPAGASDPGRGCE